MNDVIGGQVPLFFGNLASTLPHIQSGKLRPLAITGAQRSPLLPNVPTLAEAGVKGAEIHEWNALFAPAGVPAPVVARLSDALQKAMASQAVRQRIEELGGDIHAGTTAHAQQFIRDQTAKATQLIKVRDIKVE